MPVIHITNPGDPRLEDYRDIRDRDLLGPDGRGGLFIAEAALPVERLLSLPGRTKSVLIAPSWESRIAPQAADDLPVYVAPLDVLREIAGFPIHRGVLAVGYRPDRSALTVDAAVPSRDRLTLLACEDVNNIDNVGMLFRNAAAFGVDAVLLSDGCHDPLYRKSVRVSIGHVLTTPWARCEDLAGELRRLREHREMMVVAACTDGIALDKVERAKRTCVVVGAEFDGVSAEVRSVCDHVARIPMASGVDSLNVGVAAAVFLHRFAWR